LGGKKYKQQKHKTDENLNKPLLLKENGQEYTSVAKLLDHSSVNDNFYGNQLKKKGNKLCSKTWIKKKRQ
jgi:hypothetical protein